MKWFRSRLDQNPDEIPEPSEDGNRVSLDTSNNVDDESPEPREDSGPNGDTPSDKSEHLNGNSALEMSLVTSAQGNGHRRSLEELADCLDRGVTVRPTRTRVEALKETNQSGSRGRVSFLARPTSAERTLDEEPTKKNLQADLPSVVPSRYGPGWINTASRTQDVRYLNGEDEASRRPPGSDENPIAPQGRNHLRLDSAFPEMRQDFASRSASAFINLTKFFVRDKQFSGNCLHAESLSLDEAQHAYNMACAHLHILPDIADSLVGVVFRGSALKFFNKLHQKDRADIDVTFKSMRERYLPGNLVRATEQTWEQFSWNQILRDYPDVTEPSSLVQLLVEKGEMLQDRLPLEYRSDVHLRNWLVKCISGTVFKKYMPVARSSTSTGVAIEIGRSLELHREETSQSGPSFGNSDRYPRRYSSKSSPVLYELEDGHDVPAPACSNPSKHVTSLADAAELDEVEVIFLATQGYSTRIKAHDNSHGSQSFRGVEDTREPPRKPGEKENECSKKSGKQLRCFRCNSRFHYVFNCPEASPAEKVHFSSLLKAATADEKVTESLLVTIHNRDCDVFLADSPEFLGCCIDTGCLYEVVGQRQHDAFRKEHGLQEYPLIPSNRTFRFGKTVLPSMGRSVLFFFSSDGTRISYESDVVNLDIPALIGLSLLSEAGADILVQRMKLVARQWQVDLLFKHGHLYISSSSLRANDVMFSKDVLAGLHKKLGHATADTTERFLSIAQPEPLTNSDRKLLKEVLNECVVCEKFGPRPRRLRAIIPANVVFNHEVTLDVYYLHGYPALSVMCTSTSFVASSFLESRSSSNIWDTFTRIWCFSYNGTPTFLRLDAAGEHTSREFRELAAASGIQLVFSPVESHWSLGAGERVHASLRNIFQKLHLAAPLTSYATKLKTADFAFNTCPPRQGSPPSLLVFGQVSRPPCADIDSYPALKNDERLGIMAVARAEAEVQHARRRYIEVERRAAPTDCDSLSTGDLCLVYRDVGDFVHHKPGFTGPFVFLYRQGSVAFVLDGSDVRKFAASHVKPATASEKYREDVRTSSVSAGQLQELTSSKNIAQSPSVLRDKEFITNNSDANSGGPLPGPATLLERSAMDTISSNAWISSLLDESRITEQSEAAQTLLLTTKDKPATNLMSAPYCSLSNTLQNSINQAVQDRVGNDLTVGADIWITELITPSHPGYREDDVQVAITEEIQGLLDRGTFELVLADSIPKNANIMGTRIVLALKNFSTPEESVKARLVVQGCGDRDGAKIVSEAPTVSHFAVRLLITVSVIMNWDLWSKDARQAFLQSKSGLSRRVYARIPRELRVCFRGFLMLLLKPLYGLKESGSYWHDTYTKAFSMVLNMVAVFLDPCFLVRHHDEVLDGVAALLVDDTLMSGTPKFSQAEEKMHCQFDMGPTQVLTKETSVKFGGVLIRKEDGLVHICQQEYISKLTPLETSNASITDLRQGRGKPAWVATWTRPDISYRVGKLSQVTEDTLSEDSVQDLNDVISNLLKTSEITLRFPDLDATSLYLAAYGDASLGGNADMSSQMGGVIVLRDSSGSCHLLHWFSRKCPRVTSSVLAAEVIACVTVFDIAYALREVLEQVLKRRIPLYLFTDSYSLFSTVTKYQSVREKRLLIDLAVIRQSYRRFEVDNIGFIRTVYNIADPLTKNTTNVVMDKLLRTGKLSHPVDEFIVRDLNSDSLSLRSARSSVDLSIFFSSAWS
jgi:Reverse transcriptase (RNA-dependent DNA polymerase)